MQEYPNARSNTYHDNINKIYTGNWYINLQIINKSYKLIYNSDSSWIVRVYITMIKIDEFAFKNEYPTVKVIHMPNHNPVYTPALMPSSSYEILIKHSYVVIKVL